MKAYWPYWAKISNFQENNPTNWHLLPFHLMDVAAQGLLLLERDKTLANRLSKLLKLSLEKLKNLIIFFFCLHDIGKFADTFQSKNPELYQKLLNRTHPKAGNNNHAEIGYYIWQKYLAANLFEIVSQNHPDLEAYDLEDLLIPLARAVMGHHGAPPSLESDCLEDSLTAEDKKAITDWFNTLCELATLDWLEDLLHNYDEESLIIASWLVAGMVVFCDWLGSNPDHFAYHNQPIEPGEYFESIAKKSARQALEREGLIPPPVAPVQNLAKLFPGFTSPTPLQAEAEQWEPTESPQLVIIEDATGAGKTEAALLMVNRLMAKEAGQGFFFALPTMATSNAMYSRMAHVYGRLFQETTESKASLVLAHGSGRLQTKFLRQKNRSNKNPLEQDAFCAAWLADNRKKALLAQVGIGTIDQALMGVLALRHQCLRLLGLSRNLLLVDEVHAYDSYMHGLLCNLLKYQAAFGGSAILLSASLPQKTRQELVDAFNRGLKNPPIQLKEDHYPLLTWSAQGKVREIKTPAWKRNQRKVRVDFVSDKEQVLERILSAAEQGHCVCWIRNTVADAFDAWKTLKDKIPSENLHLFHARFPLGDRLAREEKIQNLFGKNSTQEQRAGQVLVSTQVIEQSLDVDFDVLISDLGPIDLIIQRAGRLQRHPRPYRTLEPVLIIHAPEFTEEPGEDWYKKPFPKAAFVYPDHARLWLTARGLKQKGFIQVPEGVRELMEGVYGPEVEEQIPCGLQASFYEAEGKSLSHQSVAYFNQLNLEEGYAAQGDKWLDDQNAPTRLGEKSTNLYLAKWDGGRLTPWYKETDPLHAWAMSQVNVAAYKVEGPAEYEEPITDAIEKTKESLPDKGKFSVLLPLFKDPVTGCWQGEARGSGGKKVALICSRDFGVEI